MPRIPTLLAAVALSLGAATPLMAMRVSLSGSHSSMVHQNAVAQEESYTFLRTPAQVREFTAAGRLVEVPGNDDYQVASGVSFPVARPALLTFGHGTLDRDEASRLPLAQEMFGGGRRDEDRPNRRAHAQSSVSASRWVTSALLIHL